MKTKIQKKKELRAAIIKRDGYRCLKCGNVGKKLNASHIFPAGNYKEMEFMLDNLKLLCWRCHRYWWHLNPIEAYKWYVQTIPLNRRRRLERFAKQIDKKRAGRIRVTAKV